MKGPNKNNLNEYQRAEQWIEKTYGVSLDNLEKLREYASKAQYSFMVPHYPSVIHKAWEVKNIDELQTSIEKCYNRENIVGSVVNKCRNGELAQIDKKKQDEIRYMEWVFPILQYRVLLPEMLYAMQIKKLRKNANFDETLNNIHKYWTWMCEVYLDETEVYMSMLEDYESENYLEK